MGFVSPITILDLACGVQRDHAMLFGPCEETKSLPFIVVCVACRCGEERFEADAVVMAVGINGATNIIRASPALNALNSRSIDVVAVRTHRP
jgi:hypothetical protein